MVLNLAIGQGENTQTLINMVKFYAALAGNGKTVTPYLVERDSAKTFDLGLKPEQLQGLRKALIAVVEHGTAARSRRADLEVAGKTGTAQNPHGEDHGWFIGFAPADKPQIVVGAIFEFGVHGTVVAPYVVKAISRYVLGPDSAGAPPVRIKVLVPDDSAPRAVEITPREGPLTPDTMPIHGAPEPMRKLGVDRPLLIATLLICIRAGDALFGGADRRAVCGGLRGMAAAVGLAGSWRHSGCNRLPHLAPTIGMGLPSRCTCFHCAIGATLVIGRGAGTAASSKSWIYIGGHAVGQPAELAKIAVILMLARHLSGRREAPQTLRDRLSACLIAGVPALLVLKQPDLGSAIVFLPASCSRCCSGPAQSLRSSLMLASPVVSLLLALQSGPGSAGSCC